MTTPTLIWFRKDFRLTDHPALTAAVEAGGPVIAVFVHDETNETLGAAPRWRLGQAVAAFSKTLEARGSRLILRRGPALAVLRDLVEETGAGRVYWSRAYDPDGIRRDTLVKAALAGDGVEARSFPGHLMFEPWETETQAGGYFRVFTPFWRALSGRDLRAPLPAPARLPQPMLWPDSDTLGDWQMGAAMNRGAGVLASFARVGAAAASERLAQFMAGPIRHYAQSRDAVAEIGATSCLSEPLAWGEISPLECWHAGQEAMRQGAGGAEAFLRQLVWRDFAYHLLYHTPHIVTRNWKEAWDSFPWQGGDTAEAEAWRQARTGVPLVDAGLREMYVTGRMHNRARMVVASYLTKHLMTDWRVGQRWFAECLIDWDPASNAMGWQWAAGSGPDAAPFFRIFNPETQAAKFDPERVYVRRWIAEGQATPHPDALRYFEAIPRSWGLRPDAPYPGMLVTLAAGRQRALDAYSAR